MDFGKRLLPHVLDHYAKHEPARVYASIPNGADVADGYTDITMAAMADIVNYMAWQLDEIVKPANALPTIAYVGPADLRYPMVFLAGIKSGTKVLFMSPRNTLQQNVGMLERTQCSAFFHAHELSALASQFRDKKPDLNTHSVDSFITLLEKSRRAQFYPLEVTFDQVKDQQCLILHSSGSTGDPKLVPMTHGTIAVTDLDRFMPTPEGRKAQNGDQFNFSGGGRFFCCFPPYHLAGVQAFVIQPIFSDSATPVLAPATVPPSGWMLAEIMKHQKLRAFYVPPFIIEQWATSPDAMEQAKSLDWILFGGGPLSPNIGDALSKATNVCQMYGSLETGQVQLLIPQPGEWSYMELNPFEEADMQDAGDGLYEMVLHQESRFADHRSVWHNFPDVKTWRTGDLFRPHPTKAGLWRFDSRKDDLIVLSSGHKIRPLEMETIIQGDPLVSGALIVGQARPQPVLLVEPREDVHSGEDASYIDRIWETVKQANSKASTYGQIMRSKVVIARPDKPFRRAPKGSIVRKLTATDYETEIASTFAETDQAHNNGAGIAGIDSFLLQGVESFVRNTVHQTIPDVSLSDTDDFFSMGLDSLKAAELGRNLRSGLAQQMSSNLAKVSLRLIYRHPSIKTMAPALLSLIQGHDPDDSPDEDAHRAMEKAVEEFTFDLRGLEDSLPCAGTGHKLHVVLLGPRGSLGPYVAQSILNNPRVARLTCLSRGKDGQARLVSSFNSRGLNFDVNDSRVAFMPVDLSKPRLGLSETHYSELVSSADVIIHNAWKVDFALTLDSYKVELIRSVRDLVDLSSKSERRPRIVYISSISSVQEWARIYPHAVTEAPLPSYDVVSPLGYGQSKHVSERLLVHASETCKIPVTILRVGQVAGPTDVSKGKWTPDEWIPSVAAISKVLNLIPTDIPDIDWIPVDLMARAISELSLPHDPQGDVITSGRPDNELRVYNLVNPRLSPWSTFVDVLQKRIGKTAKRVTLKEWVTSLAQADAAKLPQEESANAMKILPFFQHLSETAEAGTALQPLFETGKARAASPAMNDMVAIDERLIDIWCTQWRI